MVRPSNSKLMARILEAVSHLGENKGSSVRDILQLVKKGSNGPNRNLTMQVQRALKHAVTAGILKHRNGRYKNMIALASISQPPKRRRAQDNYKVVEEMPDVDEFPNTDFGSVQDRRRGKKKGSRRKGSRRRKARRKSHRRSKEEYDDMGPTHDDEKRKMSFKSRNQKNRHPDKYSDISGSEHESRHRSRRSKPEHTSRRSTSRHQPREEIAEKSNRRSSSRHRSQQRTTQPTTENSDTQNGMDCDDDAHDTNQHGQDNDNCDNKNCGSESSLN